MICISKKVNKKNMNLTIRKLRVRFPLRETQKLLKKRRIFRRRNRMSSTGGQVESEFVNLRLTTPYKEEYKSFYLKKSVWEAIKLTRGWHERGAISRFAEELGITRQAAARIVSGHDGCSAFMMRRIKGFMNINGQCWCHLFEESRCDTLDHNHPMQALNYQKYMGVVPYNRFSQSAAERSQDYQTEMQKR